LTNAARSWVQGGFQAEDDFDAMAGLLSMLQVVTCARGGETPNSPEVRQIEGWILGQEFIDDPVRPSSDTPDADGAVRSRDRA